MKISGRLFGTVLATLAVCSAASAQRLDETIEVSIVNVDVHVTDREGNRVTGLRAEDFEVRDDGKVQAITNFSEVTPSLSAAAASIEGQPPSGPVPAAGAAGTRARRTVIVFIEPVTLANFRTKQIFDSIRELLHGIVAGGDRVSIVSFTAAMRVREPFTDDLAAVDRALAQLEKEMSGVQGSPFEENARMLAEAAEFEEEFEEALQELGVTNAQGPNVPMAALAAARRQRFLIRQKAAALESLMQGISGADGKKIVIMAMRRFGLYAGAEYFGGTVPGPYRQELDTSAYRDSLIRTANAHGIAVYAIYPEGLPMRAGTDPEISGHARMESTLEEDLSRMSLDDNVFMNETAALQEVAEATGGLSARNSVDIAKVLPRVSDDLEYYYSIGYRTPSTRRDATRRIVVKTKNPAYVVRARQQFVEKSDVTLMNDRVVANLYQKVGGSSAPVEFDVAVGELRKTGRNRWSVPLKVKVPIRALTALPRGNDYAGEFSIYVATGSVLGVMSEVDRKSQTFRFPAADLERARGSHFTYDLELTLDRLANRLSIGVMDEVGKEYGLRRYMLPKRVK